MDNEKINYLVIRFPMLLEVSDLAGI